MLEKFIGKRVNITMAEVEGTSEMCNRIIVEVEGTLIELEDSQVINTASYKFVKLELSNRKKH